MKVEEFVENMKVVWDHNCYGKQAIAIIESQRATLKWIYDACGDSVNCKCGRPTGIPALKSHARQELERSV